MTRRNSKRACGWACAFWSSKTTWWPHATPCNSRPPTIRLPDCGPGAPPASSRSGTSRAPAARRALWAFCSAKCPERSSRGGREKSALGILLCDLDDFKCINDTRGHEAGDEVLREVARHFKGAARPYDAVRRYGAEEFSMLLTGCELPTTRQRAEELRAA